MALRRIHFFVIVLIFFADQISKFFVAKFLSEPITILPFFKLALVRNIGVAFGLLQEVGLRWFFVLFSVVAVVFLFKYSKKQTDATVLYSIAFVIAGALGNAVDRLLFGSVVDFIAFAYWYAFNIADSAITVGIIGLLYSGRN